MTNEKGKPLTPLNESAPTGHLRSRGSGDVLVEKSLPTGHLSSPAKPASPSGGGSGQSGGGSQSGGGQNSGPKSGSN